MAFSELTPVSFAARAAKVFGGRLGRRAAPRGNDVMLGYYRDPEATVAAATRDGWLRTGKIRKNLLRDRAARDPLGEDA